MRRLVTPATVVIVSNDGRPPVGEQVDEVFELNDEPDHLAGLDIEAAAALCRGEGPVVLARRLLARTPRPE